MRCEAVDMSELTRRIEEEIYDKQEFEEAMQWVNDNCIEGEDINPEEKQLSRKEKDQNALLIWNISGAEDFPRSSLLRAVCRLP